MEKQSNLAAGFGLGKQLIRKFTANGQNEYNNIILDMKQNSFLKDRLIYKEFLNEDFLTDSKYTEPIGKSYINLDEFTKIMISQRKKNQIQKNGLPIITHFEFHKYLSSTINSIEINNKNIYETSDWLLAFCFPYFLNPKSSTLKAPNKYAITLPSNSNRPGHDKAKHYIFAPYQLFSIHGESTKLFLSNWTYMWGDRIEGVAGRPQLLFSRNIIDTINITLNEIIPDNIVSTGDSYGSIKSKFTNALIDLQLTLNGLSMYHDIDNMDVEEVLKLIPKPFKEGKEAIENWKKHK